MLPALAVAGALLRYRRAPLPGKGLLWDDVGWITSGASFDVRHGGRPTLRRASFAQGGAPSPSTQAHRAM